MYKPQQPLNWISCYSRYISVLHRCNTTMDSPTAVYGHCKVFRTSLFSAVPWRSWCCVYALTNWREAKLPTHHFSVPGVPPVTAHSSPLSPIAELNPSRVWGCPICQPNCSVFTRHCLAFCWATHQEYSKQNNKQKTFPIRHYSCNKTTQPDVAQLIDVHTHPLTEKCRLAPY